ncbi:MAG TPA: preprotein translocase subunit SecE [Candidatus Blautia avistercoris]|uniref:preprotein translocase subunit SecE n=1 Tax=Blautia sp. An249 TaxID=1965603 RepID=UPI000B37AEB8|nr:preprotein translocase subunit SecE [Blautia sp. An249]OUO76659.1 preprotein translocase subunit SecE [Blautia sp. An249]HIY20123.1 preprotein translocase subunit SecE [Candidatus Blautia avistercoris]
MQGNEKAAGKGQKKSWFQGLQAEYKKIIWTDRNTLVKQTVAVVVITVIMSLLISLFDSGILAALNLLLK